MAEQAKEATDEGAHYGAKDPHAAEVLRHAQDMTDDVRRHLPQAAADVATHVERIPDEVRHHSQEAVEDVRRETPILIEHVRKTLGELFGERR
ncbi:hypothetical protein [Arabiibacter massiliensis]|uniref:hypothetical protein n=1 Tax=Arabiibacter massiliensis TaxID=1870985 RepID=UPI0009B9F982|nr:hypothetical protein [Arabiibacter massiliensis]